MCYLFTDYQCIIIAILLVVKSTTGVDNSFVGCDYYENILLGHVYDVFSPNFPEKYEPNTMCRWSGCSKYGTQIVINCTFMAIPTVRLNKTRVKK